jgi:hypothetical protein
MVICTFTVLSCVTLANDPPAHVLFPTAGAPLALLAACSARRFPRAFDAATAAAAGEASLLFTAAPGLTVGLAPAVAAAEASSAVHDKEVVA